MVRKTKKNFDIIIILKKYKNTLNNFIDSSNLKFLDQPKLIDKKSCIKHNSKNSFIQLLEARVALMKEF